MRKILIYFGAFGLVVSMVCCGSEDQQPVPLLILTAEEGFDDLVPEEEHTLEEVNEPFLIQEGYIQRTPQGRVIAPKGWEAIGLPPGGDGEEGQLNLL